MMPYNRPINLAAAQNLALCANCKVPTMQIFINEAGACVKCESGAQILSNAVEYLHKQCQDKVFELIMTLPPYVLAGNYCAQQKLLTILEKDFGKVYVQN